MVVSETMGMIIMQQVLFAPHNAVPSPDSRPVLDETAKTVLANPELVPLLRVEGHADAKEREPDALSKRRAEEVVAFLEPVLVELADEGGEVEEAVGEGQEEQADRGEQQGRGGDFEGHGGRVSPRDATSNCVTGG